MCWRSKRISQCFGCQSNPLWWANYIVRRRLYKSYTSGKAEIIGCYCEFLPSVILLLVVNEEVTGRDEYAGLGEGKSIGFHPMD